MEYSIKVILLFVLLIPIRVFAEPCKDDIFLKQLSNILDIAEHLETTIIANLSQEKIPWLGRVVIKDDENDTNWCTGTLISSNTILTAKHCLNKGLPKYFCYQDRGLECSKKIEIEAAVNYDGDNTDADFVFLKLKSQIDLKNFPRLKLLSDSDLKEKDIYVLGYHNSNMNNGGEWPLMQKCKFTETLSNEEQKTNCYTRPGSSGGPIIIIENDQISIIGVTSKYYLPIAKIIGLKGSRIVPAKAFKSGFEQLQLNTANKN